MGKIETVIKDEIVRLARRANKGNLSKYAAETRRLKQRVQALETELKKLKARRNAEQATAKIGKVETAAGSKVRKVRYSPKLLIKLRTRLGLSQPQLAKLLEVSPTSISLWEKGTTSPRKDARARLAALRALGKREAKALLAEKFGIKKERKPRRKAGKK